MASMFVAKHVWKPMIMSEEEIKEVEMELEQTNKNIPYEDRYPLSENESDFADYEDTSASSESESESSESESSESESSESGSEEKTRGGSEECDNMIFQMEKSEESDDISSGELIEKPSETESTNKLSDEEVNGLAEDFVNEIIDESVDILKQQADKKGKKLEKKLKKQKRAQFQERLERVHLMKIIENTPLGNVLMYYDNNQKTFCYYGPKSIPFKYLETVARKYVKIFNCKPLYVDTKKELEKAENLLKEKQEREEMEQQDKSVEDSGNSDESKKQENNDVFAIFKSYKKTSESSSVNTDINHKSDIQNIKRLIAVSYTHLTLPTT